LSVEVDALEYLGTFTQQNTESVDFADLTADDRLLIVPTEWVNCVNPPTDWSLVNAKTVPLSMRKKKTGYGE
jgi:hypothetical protein